MANTIVHFEIIGKDGKKTRKFYGDLLGWKVDAANPMNYGLVEAGAKHGIGGGIAGSQPGEHPRVTVYAEVDDPQKYLYKAVKMGAKVALPVTTVMDGVTIAIFVDPDGNSFGLSKAGSRGR